MIQYIPFQTPFAMRILICLFGIAVILFAYGGIRLRDDASTKHHDTLVALKQDYERTMEAIDRDQISARYKLSKLEWEAAERQRNYDTAKADAFESLERHLETKREQERLQRQAAEQERIRKQEEQLAREREQALIAKQQKNEARLRIKQLQGKRDFLNIAISIRLAQLQQLPGKEDDQAAVNDMLAYDAETEIDEKLAAELTMRYSKFSKYDRNVVKAKEGAQQRKLLIRQHYEGKNLILARQYEDMANVTRGEIKDLKDQIALIENKIINMEASLARMDKQPAVSKTLEQDPFSLIPAPYFPKTPEFKNELEQVLGLDPAFRKIHSDYLIQSQVYRDMIPLMAMNIQQFDMKRDGETRNYEGNAALEKERFKQQLSSISHFSTTGATLSGLIFILCLIIYLRQNHAERGR